MADDNELVEDEAEDEFDEAALDDELEPDLDGELDEDSLEEEDEFAAIVEDDELVELPEGDVDAEEEDEDELTEAARRSAAATEDEDEDDDLVTPDDVEADLDTILKDRMVAADDEPEEDEDEVEIDDRGDPVDRIQPRRPGEFVCQSCFLVKHPSQLADASRQLCVGLRLRAREKGKPMAEQKSHVDQMLDLCLYGPLGLLVTARMKYPQMVAEGRKQLASHAKLGRFVAQTATTRGKQEAEKAMSRLRENGPPGSGAPAPAEAVDVTEASEVAGDPDVDGAEDEGHTIAEEEVIPVRHDDDDPTTAGSVAADELAIPGYDSLAASQVVQRLDGLTDRELEAVRRYEVAHRARKTVLGKVAQLQRHP